MLYACMYAVVISNTAVAAQFDCQGRQAGWVRTQNWSVFTICILSTKASVECWLTKDWRSPAENNATWSVISWDGNSVRLVNTLRRCRRAPAARVVCDVSPVSPVHGMMSCVHQWHAQFGTVFFDVIYPSLPWTADWSLTVFSHAVQHRGIFPSP